MIFVFMKKFDSSTLECIAEFICGDDARFPVYRSSSYLTRFFQSVNVDEKHDGSTRKWWVLGVLEKLNNTSAADLEKVVLRLVDPKEYRGNKEDLKKAVHAMKDILLIEGLAIVFKQSRPCLAQSKGIDIDGIEDEPYFLKKEKSDLQKELEEMNFKNLNIDPYLLPVLEERIQEIRFCSEKAPLACIFLVGSSIEGLLLSLASSNMQIFNQSKSAPKQNGTVKKINDWKLHDLIEVASDIGIIDLDIRKHSHSVRDFRNFIHPYEQASNNFSPDEDTIKIALQVFLAFFQDIQKFQSQIKK